MQRGYVVGASALALGVALGSMPALAGGGAARVVTVPIIADYNAAQVKTAGDIVTVPTGLATYSVSATGGTLEINSRFTVTLPTGFSFASQPALTDTGTATFALSSGGIGSQSVTFTVGTAPLVGGQSATLTSFAVQGATALETPIPIAAALPITMQSTNNAQINNNDAKPISAPAFASEPGIAVTGSAGVELIDLTSPTLGTLFRVGSADTATVEILRVTLQPETVVPVVDIPVLSADGLANTLSTSDTATVTIPGLFNGISAAFIAASPDCSTPVAAGTVTPSLITVPGVPVTGPLYACITSGGTTLLQANLNGFPNIPTGFTASIAPGSSTDFLGTSKLIPGFITYTGGGVINVTNFFTGDDSGYASLLRVNNAGTSPSNLFALVQPDTGGAPLTGSLGSLGAGDGTVFSEAQVAAAVSGLALANSGQRATLQLIVTGDFGEVEASSLLVNPGGVVDNVGLQQNIQFRF